jgi:hypothetical protein
MQKLITSMIRISLFTCLAILAGTLFLLPKTANKRVYARNSCINVSCGAGGLTGVCHGIDCMCENSGSGFQCGPGLTPPGAQANK